MITVYDTRTGRERPFEPLVPGQVRIYVCGITPYDRPHIGHARPAVIWDVIRRHLERRGYVVTLVQNVTDVDDRLIERARALGVDPQELARRHTETYRQLMQALDVRPPDYMPEATHNIPAIVEIIERLLDRGLAYSAGGDVYYRVRRFPDYGTLSHRDPDAMRAGARIDPSPLKDDALDFALWKGERPGEPSWSAPWGPGRPGWHVECSAMAWRYLGPVIDLHGGGVDLIFPHHENEIAQSEPALQVSPHVRYWVHNGLLTIDGIKMSKSLGNGADLEELVAAFGARTVRGYLLSTHYRTPMEFSREGLAQFERALERITRLWEEVAEAPPAAVPLEGPDGEVLTTFPLRLLAALDADFNTARAWAEVFEMVRAANTVIHGGGEAAAAAKGLARRNLLEADAALGLLPGSARPPVTKLPAAVEKLLAAREEARRRKDWATADALRDQVLALGFRIEDTREGPVARPVQEGQ
jgi:cysteinyl-tRNA synthetase